MRYKTRSLLVQRKTEVRVVAQGCDERGEVVEQLPLSSLGFSFLFFLSFLRQGWYTGLGRAVD